MKIEIRDNSRCCEHCGAGRVLFEAASNASFERDLDKHIDDLFNVPPWRLFRRRRVRQLKRFKDDLAADLRQATVRL